MSAQTELAAPAAPRPPLPTQTPRPRRLALVPTQRPALALVPALPAVSNFDRARAIRLGRPTDAQIQQRIKDAAVQSGELIDFAAMLSPDAA